ncbi:MAG: hypothetical protein RID42_00260 [Alphaproteobacteria bacterium]
MMTPDVAKRWIAEIRANGAHPFHAGDPTATRDMEDLYARAYPEEQVIPEEQAIPEEYGPALSGALTGAQQNTAGRPNSLYNNAYKHEVLSRRNPRDPKSLSPTEKFLWGLFPPFLAHIQLSNWDAAFERAEQAGIKVDSSEKWGARLGMGGDVAKSIMNLATGPTAALDLFPRKRSDFITEQAGMIVDVAPKRLGPKEWLEGKLAQKAREDAAENDRQRRAVQEKVGGYRNWEPR